jgi:hypothetical protein
MKLIETGIKKSSGGIRAVITARDEQTGDNRRDANGGGQLCGAVSIVLVHYPSFRRTIGGHVSGSLLVVRGKS